jgi:HTH-type transcriptional regulator / antitoxin HigA
MENIRPIRTEADYEWALAEIEKYFDNEPAHGTPEADRFDVLASLIEVYEDKTWPIEASDPISTLIAFMEAKGLDQSDLEKVIGSRLRASELLRRKRPLSLAMIQKLSATWRIPADLLIGPYEIARRKSA